eukprot:Seg431.1 transcript_id=Seg431.1/GoldUCD/mRNA.D3Y31 product="putative protein KIAA0754" protein_id=Seg431.1/GoldUCD/D3Y31
MSWFGSLPVTLTAGGKPIEMALVNKVKDILLSAQNDKALDVLNGYSAREVASAVGNRWVDSGVIDLISSLINKEAHSLNVTVLNASNIKLTCMDGKLDKFLSKRKIGTETEMLIIVCNVGITDGRNSIQFDNKGYHWALVVIDLKKYEIIYCDSLCMDSPSNLDSTVLPLLKFLKCNEIDFRYRTAHSSNDLGCKKRCSSACSKYPIQRDGSSCGVIVAILAAFLACCSDEERMFLLAPCKDWSLVEYRQKICTSLIAPSNFKTELRCVLLSWIAQGEMDIDLVRKSCFNESYSTKGSKAASTEEDLEPHSKATWIQEEPQGKATWIGGKLEPKVKATWMEEKLEPESNATSKKEELETKGKATWIGGKLEPKGNATSIKEGLEPKGKATWIGGKLEPKGNATSIKEELEPKGKATSIKEGLEPKGKATWIGGKLEPKNNATSIKEELEPKGNVTLIKEGLEPEGKATWIGGKLEQKGNATWIGGKLEPKGNATSIKEGLEPKGNATWIGGKLEPKSNATSIKEELEPKGNATLIKEGLEPKGNATWIGGKLEPKGNATSIKEGLEPKGNATWIGGKLEPKGNATSIKEGLEPKGKATWIEEKLEPESNATAIEKEIGDIMPVKTEKKKMKRRREESVKEELANIIIKKRKIEKENGGLSFGKNKKHMKLLTPCCGREWFLKMREIVDDDETIPQKQSHINCTVFTSFNTFRRKKNLVV